VAGNSWYNVNLFLQFLVAAGNAFVDESAGYPHPGLCHPPRKPASLRRPLAP